MRRDSNVSATREEATYYWLARTEAPRNCKLRPIRLPLAARALQEASPHVRDRDGAARAMRDADHVTIDADDAIAPRELAALAQQHGWQFSALSPQRFALSKVPA